MKILVDMNLSPDWVPLLQAAGFEAVHWSRIGNPAAKDAEILSWARENDFIVFTHDLDFGVLLANARTSKPSVLQVRTQDVSPAALGPKIIAALGQFSALLSDGALISIDEHRSRARILPLK
jgi:predicted nuclease of predicted toxin-antitoxin system